MNKINKTRSKHYYYITEDPPITLENPNSVSIKRKLPKNNKYFFIDFFDQCNLRVMNRTINTNDTFKPHSLEKYGRNILTNIQDSSLAEQKVAKFQQERVKMIDKKHKIRFRVKKQLDRSKQKYRSKSVFTIKQQQRDYYNFPHTIDLNQQKIHDQAFKVQSERQKSHVLGRLGLLPVY